MKQVGLIRTHRLGAVNRCPALLLIDKQQVIDGIRRVAWCSPIDAIETIRVGDQRTALPGGAAVGGVQDAEVRDVACGVIGTADDQPAMRGIAEEALVDGLISAERWRDAAPVCASILGPKQLLAAQRPAMLTIDPLDEPNGGGVAVKVCTIGVVVGGTEMASPSDAPEGACAAWHAGMRQISSHSRSILRGWRPKDTRATKAPNGATGRIAIAPNESTSHKRGHQVLLTVLGGNLRLCIHRDCSAHATTEPERH